jgi:site-specific recombinase XerD
MAPFLVRQEVRLSGPWYSDTRRYLEQHCKTLHGLAMHGIKRATIAEVLGKVAKDSRVVAADRCRAALQALFSWAMKEEYIDANVVAATNRYSEGVERDRVLTWVEIA